MHALVHHSNNSFRFQLEAAKFNHRLLLWPHSAGAEMVNLLKFSVYKEKYRIKYIFAGDKIFYIF